MKKRTRLVVGPLALATALLGLTFGVGQASSATTKPAAPVKIGIVTEKTGIYSAYIAEWLQGMNIGLDWATKGTNKVNGHQIKLNIQDDQDNPTTAASDFKSLVGAGYKIIGGTGDSGIADELAPLAAQNKVIYISGAAADDELTGINRYTFRSGRQAYQDVQAATSYVKALGTGKSILVLGQDYAFGQSYATDANQAFTALGDTVTSDLVPLTTTDFTPVALQVAQDKPDIVFLAWAGLTGAPLAQALDQAGVFASSHVITGLANIATYPFYGTAGLKFNYISLYTYQSPHNSANNFLIEQTQKKYNTVPDLFSADGFVWAEMVVRAIQTGGGTNVSKMIKGLEGWTFQAPKGTQTIRAADHAMLQPMFQVQMVQTVTGSYQPVTLATLSAQDTAPPVSAHFGS
jgi:branched-chain amino acid transport system substrate-binding protein